MNTRLLRLLRARRGLLKLLRDRPISGTAFSVLVHVAVIALVVWLGLPMSRPAARRGEALFVELPQIQEPAPRGNPAVRERGPDGPPEPPQPAPPRAEAPAPRPAPQAPARRAEAPAPSRPAAPVSPPPPPAPPRVASAPVAPAAPPAPVPPARPAEPAQPDPSAAPAPSPAPPQETRAPQPPPPAAAPPVSPPPSPAPSGPGIAWPPKPEMPGTRGGPAVAAIPGSGAPSRDNAPDMRSALRRGGGGGTRDGRGGIEGEPIPLDSKDPKYSDYLDRVRELIKSKWIYPCVPNPNNRTCEYKSAALEIEFGIAKDGRVPFVIVRQASQFGIYDEYAVNAIKLASPFPPVPDDLSKKGIPILARFNYMLESSSLTNLLR